MSQDRHLLEKLYWTAVGAATPSDAFAGRLPERPAGKTIVVGAGKAAAQMAAAFENAWEGPVSGVVVTRYGHAVPTRQIEVLEARHPVPDAAGLEASRRLMDAVRGLGPEDLVVALISGGGSALLPAPPPGMTLADEQSLTQALLSSGAPIGVMNRVRSAASEIKAGRLAALACPARVETYVVSDVPGDDPAEVACGPTIPRTTSLIEALQLAGRYRVKLPPNVRALLESRENTAPSPADGRFARNKVHVVASARTSLSAARSHAEELGWKAHLLADDIEGEAREVARVMAAIVRSVVRFGTPFSGPAVLLSGGETTVTVKGSGRGGRNAEFLLALAIAIDGLPGVTAMAADTDGIDGSEKNAGAFADGQSVSRMFAAGVDPREALANNDAYSAFECIGDLFTTGPTGTNINDFRAIVIGNLGGT